MHPAGGKLAKSKSRFKRFQSEILDFAHDGRGVAKNDGKTVFVHGALPGETVTAMTYRSKRHYDEAVTEEIHHASPQRVVPRCEVFGVCGGCALQHLADEDQRAHKLLHLKSDLQKIGGVRAKTWLPDLSAAQWNYRRRARLGVKHVVGKGRVLVGFRERRSAYIADMASCPVLAAPVDQLITPLADMIGALSIPDKVPQVEVAVGDHATALVFRHLAPLTAQDQQILLAFGGVHDVDIYLQPGGLHTVAPLGEARVLSYAIPEFEVEIEFQPLDFLQVNGELNRKMISHVIGHAGLRPGDHVLDLFCGLGNFSLPLARCAESVVGVEGDKSLVERARHNARNNHLDNIEFHAANLFVPEPQWAWLRKPYDVVLIDPPRAGAQEILPFICKHRPRMIAYVSCHPGTLARDASILVKDFGYRLSKSGIMDMFPHTAHVESVAFFERKQV